MKKKNQKFGEENQKKEVGKLELDFPTLEFGKGVTEVVEVIGKFGGSATKKSIGEETKKPHGSLGAPISSAKRYGLIRGEEGSKRLCLAELGKEYYLAEDDETKTKILIKAFLNIPQFRKLIEEKQFVEVPSLSLLSRIMKIDAKIPERYASRVANIFRKNLEFLKVDMPTLKESILESSKLPKTETEESDEVGEEERTGVYDKEAMKNGVKLGFIVGYISTFSEKQISKDEVLTLFNNILGVSSGYSELKKVVENVKKLLEKGYINETNAIKFALEEFKQALEKDLSIRLPANITKEIKSKQKEIEKNPQADEIEE